MLNLYLMRILVMEGTVLPAALTVGSIALVLSVVIVLVFRFFAVESDERVEQLTEMLPGANCGGCGYSGCSGYAAALCGGKDGDFTKCTVGGKETADQVAAFFGQAPGEYVPKVARVRCQGSDQHVSNRFAYRGTYSCASAHNLSNGPTSCAYGCLGLGDCERACPYDAIEMINGLSVIHEEKCVACGHCVVACPRNIIEIMPKYSNLYLVACMNPLAGGEVKKGCDIGCIGCRRCFKACPYEAITMEGNLAVIHQDKCQHCGECEKVCPTAAIYHGLYPEKIAAYGKNVFN